SVFPIMAVFVLIYGLAFSASEMEAQVAALRPFVPDMVFSLLDARLKELASNPVSHLTIGLIFTTLVALYMGSRGMRYMIFLLNIAYHEQQSRNVLRRVFLSIALTLGALIVLILSLALLAVLPVLAGHLPFPKVTEDMALWGRWPLLMVIIFGSFLALYQIAPHRISPDLRAQVPGAALATVLWLGLSVGFSYYVANFSHYGATFGALSAGVVLMLWIYYSAFIIALGAALNFEIDDGTR
ncbi:MAG: YihY/virulence factor BrkB family protein, partial [Rhizobiaceae bacterium]|nr:YihY/virulence factor BrkB family protein [Rhizobiaceae bacterium]